MEERRPSAVAKPNAFGESLEAALRLLRWVGAALLGVILLSGVTIVQPDEVALRLRLGRLTGTTAADQVHGPGLMFSLPYLIDEVVRVPVKRVRELRISALTFTGEASGEAMDLTREGYALTGDQNIVQLAGTLKYQIGDPVVWALRMDRPEEAIQGAVVTALTHTLAEMPVDAVLGEGRAQLAAGAMARAQERLDRGGHWVRLLAVEFIALHPAPQVARAFSDLQSAFVERKTKVEEARRFREQEIPRAVAEADRQVREAEGLAARERAVARGSAGVFLALLEEYRKEPQVVRPRLYREAMEQIVPQIGSRVLVPPGASKGRILIPAEGQPGGGPLSLPGPRER
jgi:membrane protease subunit HflK